MKKALIIILCVLATIALLLVGFGLGAYAGMSFCCDRLPDACGSAEPSICLLGGVLGAGVGFAAALIGSLAIWAVVARIRSRRRKAAATLATGLPGGDEGAPPVAGPDA